MSSPPNDDGSKIHKAQLKGHKGPVLCIAHNSTSYPTHRTKSHSKKKDGQGDTGNTTVVANSSARSSAHSLLLSGSEDGTARLWDLRCGNRAAVCIVAPSGVNSFLGTSAQMDGSTPEVTSVAFHPPVTPTDQCDGSDSNDQKDRGTGLNESAYSYQFTVYLSAGNGVYGYDLRNISSPVVREYTHSLTDVLENKDEVNQIVFYNPTRTGRVHLAAADDFGDIRVTDSVPKKTDGHGSPSRSAAQKQQNKQGQHCRTKVLRHAEDGAAMVTCTGFRPRAKGIDLASGGTDCVVKLWDVSRPRRPSSKYKIYQDDSGANQVCNPPMVHCLSWSPSGRLLATGLGDGTCSILHIDNRKLVETCRLREGHDSAVASVIFPRFGVESSADIAAEDRLLVSAGNDGAILLWDLGGDVAGDRAVDPATLFKTEQEAGNPRIQDGTAMEAMSISSDPKILFGIPHQKKPNWVTSSSMSDPVYPSTLFVADTSYNITAYILPRS